MTLRLFQLHQPEVIVTKLVGHVTTKVLGLTEFASARNLRVCARLEPNMLMPLNSGLFQAPGFIVFLLM